MAGNQLLKQKRAQRVRRSLKATVKRNASNRPRLSVFRSSKNIHAQVIDDAKGVTLASASTLEKDIKGQVKSGGNAEAASVVGKLVGERAAKAGVTEVVFDRGAYLYHGRVKALADGARGAGLKF
jgi:large subunit ribosomal protein L18